MAKPEVPTGPIQIDGKPEPVSIRSIKGAIASLRKVDLEMLQTLIEQKEWKRAINALNAISAKAKKVQSAASRMASRAAKQHWSPLLEETPMAERSLRTRLKDSSGSGRNYAKALHWGIRWEDLRSAWFSRCGRWADADEALARQHRLEREYVDEVGVPFHG